MKETHRITITFLMEEMDGTPEESAEVAVDILGEITCWDVEVLEAEVAK